MALKYPQELKEYNQAIAAHANAHGDVVYWFITHATESTDLDRMSRTLAQEWGYSMSMMRSVLAELDRAVAALPALRNKTAVPEEKNGYIRFDEGLMNELIRVYEVEEDDEVDEVLF